MLDKCQLSEIIKSEALSVGFLSCGISKAEFLENEAPKLEKWLNQNHHGEMNYMSNHFDKRLNPKILVRKRDLRDLRWRFQKRRWKMDFRVREKWKLRIMGFLNTNISDELDFDTLVFVIF